MNHKLEKCLAFLIAAAIPATVLAQQLQRGVTAQQDTADQGRGLVAPKGLEMRVVN